MIRFQETSQIDGSIEGQKNGQKDVQTYFIGPTHPATTKGPPSTTAVNWYLKVKNIEYNVGPTKNYCITVSMQNICSIHQLILKIQQILESHELNRHPFFDHARPKVIKRTFSFSEFKPACKKSVHSICSFLRYSQF